MSRSICGLVMTSKGRTMFPDAILSVGVPLMVSPFALGVITWYGKSDGIGPIRRDRRQ